jgi:hypothetical protein
MAPRFPLPAGGRSRRHFLKQTAVLGAALVLPAPLFADPYAPLSRRIHPATPVRVRGRVQAAGRGLAGVRVTDGLNVVRTGNDGRFELLTDTRRAFVYLSLPAGYTLPVNPTGTVRFYEPIRPDARGEMSVRFDLVPLRASDERHAFLVLADPQTQNAYEMGLLHAETVPSVQATLRTLGDQHIFGLTCGDIMFDDLALYPDYERAVQQMGIPFFQVLGNHDLDFSGSTDDASSDTFCRHFGPNYYSFDRGAVHYVVLDDVFWHKAGYFGYLDADQLEWLRQDLATVEAGRTVVTFLHIPSIGSQHVRQGQARPAISTSVTNREALYRLLEPFNAHLIAGHTHEAEHVTEGRIMEHVAGAACGAWWSGPICHDGTPNGYGVFEAQGETLRWRYQGTGLPADHQMRVYPVGSDPKAPNEIVANVWDWEPGWTVVWYEDGTRKGTMARRMGIDPLSEQLHRGPNKPARPERTWVEPMPTNHLFYAPVSPDARDVRVEATDRFGRTYMASAG